jgi:DNA polymerase-4
MGNVRRAICHLNIIGYRAAVAAVMDKNLRGRPYVISGASGGRALVLDVSREALKADIKPGMPLAAAERRIRDLLVLAPNPPAYARVNAVLERIVSQYAPVYQNDTLGNLYLDLSGTTGLFGPTEDCASRVLREIIDETGIESAAAAGSNKLVCKIGTRTIRPTGLIAIREGDEAVFLAHQSIALLPGMGPKLLRTAAITGFREIGDVAALSDGETLALFGKGGLLLREKARGIDDSPVAIGDSTERIIKRVLEFGEDVIDLDTIRGGLAYLAENTGPELRGDKLGAAFLGLTVTYADGVTEGGEERSKRLIILDREIAGTAERVYRRVVKRRIRIRSITLTLGGLKPLGWEPDLFIPEEDDRQRRVQEAADAIRNRYGFGTITTGAVMAASGREAGLMNTV